MFRDRMREVGKLATSVFTDDDGFTKVVYHSTVVAQWNRDIIMLDSRGWRTATTKVRMNQASNQFRLGYHVYQEDFEWFVVTGQDWDNPIDFEDGMVLPRSM